MYKVVWVVIALHILFVATVMAKHPYHLLSKVDSQKKAFSDVSNYLNSYYYGKLHYLKTGQLNSPYVRLLVKSGAATMEELKEAFGREKFKTIINKRVTHGLNVGK